VVADDYPNFLFAILPPGAFIGLGVLIAIKNWIDQRIKASQKPVVVEKSEPVAPGSKRVRVTG
jgi:electron transport complex protein RnfE